MPARKRAPAAKSRSGRNIPNAQRHTVAILLRLPPDAARQLRARADEQDLSLSAYVARLVATDLAII